MFSDLKLIVDLVRAGVVSYRLHKKEEGRERAALDLLRIYFLLKNCVDEGEKVINAAGPDPIGAINRMDNSRAAAVLADWDATLKRQGFRLHSLQGLIFSQAVLGVVGPDIETEIVRVVGNKMTQVTSLHRIGAVLFIRSVFPVGQSSEETADQVAVMAGSESSSLDLDEIRQEIEALRASLEDYRGMVERFVSDEELLRLAKRAKEESL